MLAIDVAGDGSKTAVGAGVVDTVVMMTTGMETATEPVDVIAIDLTEILLSAEVTATDVSGAVLSSISLFIATEWHNDVSDTGKPVEVSLLSHIGMTFYLSNNEFQSCHNSHA